ncbi:acetylxylan esterase [Actinocatenispora sera]|uniref:acetylxylan esterase n=1 Tax=Actinocatenispora sera TaxID=390989 RepID=UPI0033DB1339
MNGPGFGFDPTYGYDLDGLLAVGAPAEPAGFAAFWRERYAAALAVDPDPVLGPVEDKRDGCRVLGVTFSSVGGVRLGGWVVLPDEEPARHGFVVGHGYGGRATAGLPLPLPRAAAIQPCVRGLPDRGRIPGIPDTSDEHVLHGIETPETYVLAGCVADLWCAATALRQLVPELDDRLGYLGQSLGGGLGALALPWDDRFAAAQLTVPTFGNQPLRLTLECAGSGESVRRYARRHPEVTEVLAYFDAASAARRITVPTLVGAALLDPSVPPPGQFAVHNALAGPKQLAVLTAGHVDHPGLAAENAALAAATARFCTTHLAT